eukprot:m.335101 g.335101  ORF g.335101 m.335101 type:complete len:1638 (-) comp17516_c0_seq1:85-4998(-)
MFKKKEAASGRETPEPPGVLNTGGEIDALVMALIEGANDKADQPKSAINDSLRTIGKSRPALVLSSIENFLLKHKRLVLAHRIALLEVMELVVSDKIDDISPGLATRICGLGVTEMTTKQEIVPEWQSAAGALLVTLGGMFGKVVLDELISRFEPGKVPHYYIVKTLGEFASNNVFALVPQLETILGRLLPMLGMIKQENMKFVFTYAISRFCDAIVSYVANMDRAPDKSITVEKFSVQMYSAFEVVFNVWLNSKESKLRLAVVECVGLMTQIIAKDKLEETIGRIIPGMLALYKKHPGDALSITQGLSAVLTSSVKDGNMILSPHLDTIMATLYPLVQTTPDYTNPSTVKAYNEILRCFESICVAFSDRLMAFLFLKLEDTNEACRVGTLSVLKHLINASGQYMTDKRELVVSGLRPILADKSTKVRSTLAQVVIALAHHDYLSLVGGHVLVQFIVDQCALDCSADNVVDKKGKPPAEDHVSLQQLRNLCENVLNLSVTTIATMRGVLWPYLLEFIVPEQYTRAIPIIAKSLGTLAEKMRDEDDEIYDLDYDVMVNLPRPQEFVARLIVLLGHPLEREIGLHILYLFEGMSPNIHEEIVDLWDDVIPRLTAYLEKHAADKNDWDQQTWEDLVLKLLSRTLDHINDEEWVAALGRYLGDQYCLYKEDKYKNMLSKCLGAVLRKSSNRAFIEEHLDKIFGSVNHASQVEREGCARAFGFSASSHLDQVIEKLGATAKKEMVRKSTGFMGLMKDKSELDVARIKATLMLCYGFVTLYAQPSLIMSRVEVNILSSINPHFSNVKDASVKENLIRCVDLIGKSLHPSHLKTDKFILHRRGDLLEHMESYMKSESKDKMKNEIRSLAMDACTTLVTLEPKLSDASLFNLVEVSTNCIFQLNAVADDDEQGKTFLTNALKSLNSLMDVILAKDTTSECLQGLTKHLHKYMTSEKDHQRTWMLTVYRRLLQSYHDSLKEHCEQGRHRGTLEGFGKFVADLIPRCTDPLYSVRADALGCIQWLMRIQLLYAGQFDPPDPLVEAISKLEARADKTEPSVQFGVVNDLAKVIAKKIETEEILQIVYPLMEGLLDAQDSSASGACVVMNGLFRLRGEELSEEISNLLDALSEKMASITHERTGTGVLRAVRTLAAHHLAKVVNKLQMFDIPYNKFVVDTWHTLAQDEKLATLIIEMLIDSLQTSRPYDESTKGVKTPSLSAMKATCGLKEVLTQEETANLVQENYSRILAVIAVRVGCTCDVAPQDGLHPNDDAIETLRTFMTISNSKEIAAAMDEGNNWNSLKNPMEFTDGLTTLAASMCTTYPQHVPVLVEELEPVLKRVYDSQRTVVAAMFAEFINQRCAGSLKLINRLKNALLTKLVDPCHDVRMLVIRGLGNVASVPDEQMKKYSTTVLSAMMTGMDDRDDPNDLITLEAMRGLSKVLAKVEEDNVRQILINISLRIRPCFEKDKPAVRAAAIKLFGNLSRFGDGPSRAPFSEQIHANMVSLLLHLNDEDPEVRSSCKDALRDLGPLLDSESVNSMFQKLLKKETTLHYGEFMNDLSKIMINEFEDKINFYTMNNVNFFKSEWPEIKANAAMFTGFLLGNLTKDKRKHISKEHVCGELIRLLKDPANMVREKAAEAMSLLTQY